MPAASLAAERPDQACQGTEYDNLILANEQVWMRCKISPELSLT